MLYRTYAPFVRKNEEEEKQIIVNEELRTFLENHPNKDGEIIDIFYIDLTAEDIASMKQLATLNDETKFVNSLEVGDYIMVEPHTYIGSD